MSGKVARRVVVTGRVQGVGYRESCRSRADRHGVAGWVRNLPDGAVEAHLEGPVEEVEALIRWCGQGPPYAQVRTCTVQETEPEGFSGFRVG